MNEGLLCIGSNIDRKSNLEHCQRILMQIFDSIQFSDTLVTAPYGERYNDDFLNQLAFIKTTRESDDVIELLKGIERQLGRMREDKILGVVKIDIDLITWNDSILREEDWERSYIRGLLPNFVSELDSQLLSSILNKL